MHHYIPAFAAIVRLFFFASYFCAERSLEERKLMTPMDKPLGTGYAPRRTSRGPLPPWT